MRYAFIQAEKAQYPVEVLCRVMVVARSGFYAWRQRSMSMRAQENQGLVTQIRACYQASRGRYGSPRIHQDLGPTDSRLDAIAWRGSCGSMGSVVSADAGPGNDPQWLHRLLWWRMSCAGSLSRRGRIRSG